MRVALYHNLPSGGGKRAVHDFARGLIRRGHIVDAFVASTADHTFMDIRPIVAEYRCFPLWVHPGGRGRRSHIAHELASYWTLRTSLVKHAREVAAAIDSGTYDVAFIHNCQFSGSPYLLGSLETPSVYYCHEPRRAAYEYTLRHSADRATRAGRWAQTAHRWLFDTLLTSRDEFAARSATAVLTNSRFSLENIKRAYGRYGTVCYPGVDRDAFLTPSGLARRRVALSVGALHASKGHDIVVDALGRIARGTRPELHIVADRGEQSYAESLDRQSKATGVTLVIHRSVDAVALANLYGTALVVVCAAELEPFGYAPLEAMACGTPVVAVCEGGFRETIDHEYNGLLVDRNAERLADAIQRLAVEPKTWERLHRGALDCVRDWSLDSAVARLEEQLHAAATAP